MARIVASAVLRRVAANSQQSSSSSSQLIAWSKGACEVGGEEAGSLSPLLRRWITKSAVRKGAAGSIHTMPDAFGTKKSGGQVDSKKQKFLLFHQSPLREIDRIEGLNKNHVKVQMEKLKAAPVLIPTQPVLPDKEHKGVLRVRLPVVTVMGHVDLGETSFLDVLRETSLGQYSSVPEPKVDQGGIVPIPLSQTGEGIADCELLRWYVQEGDEVDEFQPLCEVQSDKASVEITSRYKGKVTRVLYTPGDIVKVGETLLELIVEGDQSLATPMARGDKSETESTGQVSPVSPFGSGHKQKEILTTPAVRQLARSHGLDLAALTGTGRDGRILKEDVVKFALFKEELNEEMRGISEASRGTEGTALQSDSVSSFETYGEREQLPGHSLSAVTEPSVADHPREDQIIPVRGFRRIMAKTMAAAVSVPHFHYTEDIGMNAIVQLKNSLKDTPLVEGVKVTYLPFLIKALSLALVKYPVMNSTVNQDVSEIHVHSSHNIGIGMATSSGLVVPNIKNVQRLSITKIAEELARLTQLAGANKLSSEDVTGGTITVSNFGTIGGKYGSPVLSIPEVAIVAIGRIQTLPRYNKDGILYPASIMGVTWGADHRVIDGATVASFCNEWKGLIEQPGLLLLNIR